MAKEFRFPSTDGKTSLFGVLYEPAGEPRAVLQIVHGMCEHIGRYDRFMTFMAENGFVVTGHDHLGHGKSAAGKEDLGYFGKDPDRLLIDDMQALRERTEKAHPGLPYFILGHSMGSYLLRMYLAKYGTGLAGAIVMGTGYVDPGTSKFGLGLVRLIGKVRGEHHRSKLAQNLTYDKSYAEFDVTGTVPEKSWLTRDTEIAKKFYADPLCGYRFTVNGYEGLLGAVAFDNDPKNVSLIPKDLPILLISGEKDPVGSLGAGVRKVEELFKAAGIQDVTTILYPEARHEVLNETNRDEVDADILRWCEKHMCTESVT